MWPYARDVWALITLLAPSFFFIVAPGEAFVLTPSLVRRYTSSHSPGNDGFNIHDDSRWNPLHCSTEHPKFTRFQASEDSEVQELRLLTWMEVESRIQRDIADTGAAAAIVPLGATEQHGPTGLIGTDHMTAEAVARRVSAATGTLVTPCVNFGMSCHHSLFAGTVTLTPATLVGVVRDVADSLFRSGFTHVLFINGHGGNIAPTYKAFADLQAEREDKPPSPGLSLSSGGSGGQRAERNHDTASSGKGAVTFQGTGSNDPSHAAGSRKTPRMKLINWYTGKESAALAKKLYADEVGQHATPDEVAITQHLFPSSIKAGVALDPAAIQVAKDLKGKTIRNKDEATGLSVMDPEDFRRRFPDGRMYSNPGLATPEHGRQLLDAAVRDAIETLRKFISGEDIIEEQDIAAAALKGSRYRRRWGDDKSSGSGGRREGRWGQSTTPNLPPAHGAPSEATQATDTGNIPEDKPSS